MNIVIVIFVFLVLPRSDAAFNWIHHEASVEFTEEGTARLAWTVDIGSSFPVSAIHIKRGQSDSKVITKTTKEITKHLPGREQDIDLIINGPSNITNITFVFRNLVREDEMNYKVTVANNDVSEIQSRTTFLRVLALPKLQFQPNQVGFCVHDIVNITCNATFKNVSPSNFTFFRNATEVESKRGTLKNGTTFQAISMFQALNQVGAFIYSCNASNQDEGRSGMSYGKSIKVKDPPHIISCKDNIVEEGSSLFWQCSANGSEPLTTSWHRGNNMELLKSGQSLTIANVSRADGGLYIFKASNGEGCAAASKTVQLDVQYIGEANCDASPGIVKENANFVLNCSAAGNPPVNYTWVLPGSQDVNQPMRSVKATVAHDGVTVTCKAKNGFGNKECVKTITVHYKPHNVAISPASVPALNTDDALSLKCTATSNPAGSYTWSLNGNPLTGETRGTLTKAQVTPQDSGRYTCTVSNSEGNVSSNVVAINVNYSPKIECEPNRFIEENTTGYVFQCTKPSGSPEPSLYAVYKGDNYNDGSVSLPLVDKTINGSVIQCFATNTLGKAICETKLFLGSLDLRACLDVSYALVTNSCLFSIPADGFPKPNLTCDVHNATKHNYTICTSGGNVDTIGTNCYISNSIRRCNFTVPVFARVPNNITKKYTMAITNQEFKTEYTKKDSDDFKMLKEKLEGALYKIYKYVKYVIAIDVMEFLPGSVHVNFEIRIIANVSDVLVPLQKELNRTQGSLDGQYSIHHDSLRSGWFVPKPPVITTEPPLSTGAIVGIAIGCVLFVILIIVLLAYWCYRKKKKAEAEKNDFLKDENGMPLRYIPFPHEVRDDSNAKAAEGVENKGMTSPPSKDIASGSQLVVKMKDNASTSKTGSK